MEVDFDKYNCFLAECYEAEDEFWKGVYEEIEADYWINKINFDFLTKIINQQLKQIV